MFSVSEPVAVAAAVVAAVAGFLVWRRLLAAQRVIAGLRARIGELERMHAERPRPRVAFEFRTATREAWLHVVNEGADADFWAPMTIEGPLAHHVSGAIYGDWQSGPAGHIRVRRGETRSVRLARLDLTVFPYAQWEIFGMRPAEPLGEVEGGRDRPRAASWQAFAVRAMHTSTIGGDPETHAPVLLLQVDVVSAPEPSTVSAQCTIALQPFEAVRVRGF